MTTPENKLDVVKSPCIRKCYINKRRICVGCGRTEQEISNWKILTSQQKMAIIDSIKNGNRR